MVFACYIGLLGLAATFDVWRFIIPNAIPAALAALFVAVALTATPEAGWAPHAGAALVAFLAGAALHRFGLLGGGDVKLMAALALWTGFERLLDLTVAVALCGGILALALVAVRRLVAAVPVARVRPDKAPRPRVLTVGEGVPYGVAIAAGGLIVGMGLPQLGIIG